MSSDFAARLRELAASLSSTAVEFSGERDDAKALNALMDMAERLENIAHTIEPDPRRHAALTPMQDRVLTFIRDFIAGNGYAPTRAEIAEAFSCAVNNIQEHVAALKRKGYVTCDPGVPRGIRLSKRPATLSLKATGVVA